jgi:hypothetical protein
MKLQTANDTSAIYYGLHGKQAHFKTIDAFIEYNDKQYCHNYDTNSDWTMHTPAKKLKEMIKNRDTDSKIFDQLQGSENLDNVDGLDTFNLEPREQLTHGTDGFLFNSGAYYAGEQDYMLTIESRPTESRTIWLALDIISRGSVDAMAMTRRASAVIRAARTLQTCGYSVGLIAYINGIHSNGNAFVSVVVKNPDEDLNENVLANTLAHPSFFRTIGHNAVAKLMKDSNGSMNSAPREKAVIGLKNAFAPHDQLTVLDGSFDFTESKTDESINEWINNQIEIAIKQGRL